MQVEADIAELEWNSLDESERPGTPFAFACPDCGGVLWELHDGKLLRFRCRVGHAWTAASLLERHSDALETVLWVALRALEEKVSIARRLADRRGGGAKPAKRRPPGLNAWPCRARDRRPCCATPCCKKKRKRRRPSRLAIMMRMV